MTLTDEQLRYLQKGLERSRTAIVAMATELLAARARLRGMEAALQEVLSKFQMTAALTARIEAALAQPAESSEHARWPIGTLVEKTKGASWRGRIVGYYTTSLTPEGYCIESDREPGSVQIYPRAAIHEAKS